MPKIVGHALWIFVTVAGKRSTLHVVRDRLDERLGALASRYKQRLGGKEP